MLDGRKAIVEHHILHMQLILLKKRTTGLILCQFNVMKLPVHLYNGIIQNNSQIVTYHFNQQTVFFPAVGTCQFQGQYPHAMLVSPCFYPQRQETPFHDTAPLHLSGIVTPLKTFMQFFLILFCDKTCRFQVSGFLVIHSQCQILQQQHLVQLVKHAPDNPVQHLITESFRTRGS